MKIEAYHWSMLLFKIKHYKLCQIVFSLHKFSWSIPQQCPTLPTTTFLWVPQHLDLQSQPPPKSCMLLHAEPQTLKRSGAEPEKVGLGHISQFLFLSFFLSVSVPPLLTCVTENPAEVPHALPVRALILHRTLLLPFHSFCTTQVPSIPFQL